MGRTPAGKLFHVNPGRVGGLIIKTVCSAIPSGLVLVLISSCLFFFLFSSMCLASREAVCVIKDASGYVVLFAGRLQTRQLPT